MATLSVRLFGSLDLRLGDNPLPALGSARAESLLAYLLLNHDAPQPRQQLAFRLWPESSEAQARTNLRHVLHDLRRALPDAGRFLDVQPRTVQWRPVVPCRVDVAEFEAAVASADNGLLQRDEPKHADDEIAALRRAVALHRGDLLETCYDEWITDHRERLRRRYLAALERLAERLENRGNHAEAIAHVERILRHDPLREAAYRTLMRLHDARGDRARALHAYQTCFATLVSELGVGPSSDTRRAYEALLRGGSERGGKAIGGSSREGCDTAAPPLLGRADEWARLTSLWRAAQGGRPAFLLLTGEPGVGKSRLVEELRAWCALRGAVTADARSYSAEGALAYGPVVAWLRTPAIAKRVMRLDPGRLSELSRLLPELLALLPSVPPSQPLAEDEHRHRLFDAAAQALLSLGSPLVLVADDIQWCDHETLRFLHYLVRSASTTPLLVAATARLDAMERHPPLRDLITGLRALELITELEIECLTRGATGDLAATLTSRPLDAQDAEALFRETGGNPLFVIEAVRAGWHAGGRTADSLTPRVQAVIGSRLGQLSDSTRELVGVAAVLGREFSVDVLAHAAEVSTDAVARDLDELWRARIVREDPTGAYDFTHDRIREVAYLALSPGTRRRYHLRAAQALKRFATRDPDTVSGQIAAHYDRAGIVAEAITWYETASEASQRRYASRESVRLLGRALDLVGLLPDTPERSARELAISTAMLTPVASIEGFASPRLEQIQQRAIDLARSLAVDVPQPVLRSRAISSLSRDDFGAAREYGERLQARGRADGDDALLVESAYVLGIAAFWKGELETARRHFESAVAGYRPDRRRAHLLRYWLDPQVISLSRLGNTLWFLGDPIAACRARDEAVALAHEVGHEQSRRTVLVFSALLALDMDDTERFRHDVAALEAGATEHDARPTRVSTETFGAYVRVLDGEVQAGLSSIQRALDELTDGSHAPGQRAVLARLLIAAYDAARDPRGRLAAAERTIAMGGAARLWEAEAHRARAKSLMELGASDEEITTSLERALAVARRQGARMVEQRVADALALRRPALERRSTSSRAT